jgi:hypothetical protein
MRIVRLNVAEKLVSVVALDSAGEVVGHYALEGPELGAVKGSFSAGSDRLSPPTVTFC